MLSDNHKFDETTGQVYTETTASIQSADDRDWTRRTLAGELQNGGGNLDSLKPSKRGGSKGPRSLQAASFNTVLQHISDVTLEALEYLPIQVVRRLWRAVNGRSVYSLKPSQAILGRIISFELEN
jgi:hypothetical protein